MKSLFKTVVLITFFSILTRISGFIFRIILSRVVGAEGVGLYQVASSIFLVLLTIISSGLPLVISRMSAGFSAKKEDKKEGSFISVALIYALLISLIICVVVIAGKDLFAKLFTDKNCINILLVLLPSIVFSSIYCVFRGSMWGKGNYFALCITEFYEQIVRIILALLMISTTYSAIKNAFNLGLSMSIACIFSSILVVLLYFYYGGKMSKPKREYLKPLLRESSPITLMRVASSFIQPLIAIIVPSRLMAIGYTSSQALSLFGVAVGMTLPLLFVPTTIIGSLSTALIPDISKAVAQNDKSHIEKRIYTSIFFAMFISALFIPVYLGAGELAGLFLYDDILSGTLLQSSAWVLLPLGLTNITSALLNSLELENKSFINFILGSLVMFVSLWFLPSFLGINSIMWSLGLNYLVICILNILLLKKHTKVKLNIIKPLIKIILIIIPSSALTSFVVSLANYVFPLFITLVIGGCTGVASFILLCGVANLIDIKAFIVKTKDNVSKKLTKIKLKNKRAKN